MPSDLRILQGLTPREQLGLALLTRAGVFFAFVLLVWGWAAVYGAGTSGTPGPIAVWVSDRDRNQVVGLDRSLLRVRTVDRRAPLELEALRGGEVWVVSAVQSDPLGPHELARLSAAGALLLSVPLQPVLDLATDERGRAWVVELMAGGERIQRIDQDGSPAYIRTWPGASCVAAQAEHVLVGESSGRLTLLDLAAPGSAAPQLEFGGVLSDVACGPRPDTWWVLDASGNSRLALLDARLELVWSRSIGLHALHLAPVDGAERVWVADSTQPHVRRFGPGGTLEIDRSDMPMGGLDRSCAWGADGALFTAPGALLHLDARGLGAPGQAGFDFLIDVAPVR